MDIRSLSWGERSKRRLRGACQLAGHALSISLERQSVTGPAEILLRVEDGSLPPDLLAVSTVALAGRPCPVQAVRVEGATVLSGTVPADVADTQFSPPAPAPTPAPAPPDPEPAPPGGPEAPDSLVALSRQHDAAKSEAAAHAGRVEQLRAEAADLAERAAAVDEELAAAGDTAAAHAERCAELRQRIRDLLDAEEA